MKPSEALAAISMLGSLVADLEARSSGARALDTSIRSELDAGLIDLTTAGQRAAALVVEEYGGPEETSPFAGLVKDDPAPYGRRADGSPRAKPGKKTKTVEGAALLRPAEGPPLVAVGSAEPKAHVAPLMSPLTPELREKLARHLGAAPMTCEAIARMSWAVGLDAARIEALLCEAPDTFIRWQRPDSRDPRLGEDVWGLPHQFDRAVSMLDLQGAKADWAKSTVVALGCSEPAAIAAWKRLDLEKAS